MTTLTTAAGTFEVPYTTYFVLNGVPSHCMAWNMQNVTVLSKPAPKRGTQPDLVPNADGAVPNALWLDGAERTLTGLVKGSVDPEGTLHPSKQEGMISNLEFLSTYWGVIPANADSTYELIYYRKDGTTRTGDVQILDFDWAEEVDNMPFATTMIMRLYIPAGQLGAPV